VTDPETEYRRRITSGTLLHDPSQEAVVGELERLHAELIAAESGRRSLNARIAGLLGRPPAKVRGLYLWGGVGRGKTLLMDLFFHSLPFRAKRRQHFHRFMASIHERLRSLRDTENPLDRIADDIADTCRVICFDEFAVSDIADAMILGKLFTALFDRGVTLVATSNIAPQDLYRDGLQRQRFLPAIETIEANTAVIEIQGNSDYRLRVLEQGRVYQTPDDTAADARLERSFAAIAPDEGVADGVIEILGRPVEFLRMSDCVIWLEFGAICDGPRSQDDYIELAREFQTVVVSHVPQFDSTLENQARRFIALVDEFYDRKVKLILSAAVALDELYAGSRLRLEFERTRSRLTEMQSHDYFAAPHRP
jgi:cell division protein ZapE